MSQLVKMPYGNGKSILIEVQDAGVKEVEELGRTTDKAVNEVSQNLEAVSVTIVETSQILMGAFQSAATFPTTGQAKPSLMPEKAILEFGIRFSAEGNIYLAKVSGDATLKATIEWKFGSE
jgi:hypothetical protein